MKFLRLSLVILYALTISGAVGQTVHFKKYANPSCRFYFFIPKDWTIEYNRLQDGWVCIPVTRAEKAIYTRCYEGIVFRMELYYCGLDAALINQSSLYVKVGNYYYTSDRFKDTIKAQNLQGRGWTGIYHKNTCGLSCEGTGFHAADGECENIYFSNGKLTVALETNGRAFDKSVLNMLLKSVHFY